MTRSVALDLERRGFVVFCAVPPASDALIEQEGKHDLRALPLDIAEVFPIMAMCLLCVLGKCGCFVDGPVRLGPTTSSCRIDFEFFVPLSYWSS